MWDFTSFPFLLGDGKVVSTTIEVCLFHWSSYFGYIETHHYDEP